MNAYASGYENCNAKEEFIKAIKDRYVLCAQIKYDPDYGQNVNGYNLRRGYTSAEYDAFLQKLDFVYDADYGGQELFGTIWYTDGTWSSRYEYDGREEWVHQKYPEIPECLKNE